ncbi:MAG: squalene--hopene cyclase [Planctomycetaceae bacterium]|nr:squalene--hopene cyclase [Planctomycetaceae bacterium]
MESGGQNARFYRVDDQHDSKRPTKSQRFVDPVLEQSRLPQVEADQSPLGQAISSTVQFPQNRQHSTGYWVGELEGDTILESEYILLLTYLGEEKTENVQLAARYILQQQCDHGGWALYPDGPLEISASVKAYWALKITGHSPEAEYMVRAKLAILAAGGAEKINSFTKFYLALLGQLNYKQCPAVPPELMLLPKWFPVTLYDLSAWSRTIVVPLSLLWVYKPQRQLSQELLIDELFVNSPGQLSAVPDISDKVDDLTYKTRIPWSWIFRQADRAYKFIENIGLLPYRKKGIRVAASWMLHRFKSSDGLGAIFPPIVWSLVALKSLGYEEDSDEFVTTRKHLDGLILSNRKLNPDIISQYEFETSDLVDAESASESSCEELNCEETIRLQPCHSPVWDTAIASLAISEANQEASQDCLEKAAQWLRSKEVREKGDWSIAHPDIEPGGWYFEHNNEYYPDIDDTTMVLMALSKNLPSDLHTDWFAEFVPSSMDKTEKNLTTIVSGKAAQWRTAMADVTRLQPTLDALRRGVQWLLAMQSENGGWGAFDADNDQEILTRVPFADHNAMIDPPTADITARVLESLAMLGIDRSHPSVEKAIDFIWKDQEEDGSWHGRWGVNYIYGTWQVLVG